MEQDHRGVKQRSYPLRAFGSFDTADTAARCCAAHDELHAHVRFRRHLNEVVSLADQRQLFHQRWGEVGALLQATGRVAAIEAGQRRANDGLTTG